MKRYLAATATVALLFSTTSASPQVSATAAATTSDMPYEAVPNFFQAPPGDYMGELQGVATNSKGHVFAYFRGPQTRLWEFGPDGKARWKLDRLLGPMDAQVLPSGRVLIAEYQGQFDVGCLG